MLSLVQLTVIWYREVILDAINRISSVLASKQMHSSRNEEVELDLLETDKNQFT